MLLGVAGTLSGLPAGWAYYRFPPRVPIGIERRACALNPGWVVQGRGRCLDPQSLIRTGVRQQLRQAELHVFAGYRVASVRALPHSDDEARFLEVAKDTTSVRVVQP